MRSQLVPSLFVSVGPPFARKPVESRRGAPLTGLGENIANYYDVCQINLRRPFFRDELQGFAKINPLARASDWLLFNSKSIAAPLRFPRKQPAPGEGGRSFFECPLS